MPSAESPVSHIVLLHGVSEQRGMGDQIFVTDP